MKKTAYLIMACLLVFNCKFQEPLTKFSEEAFSDRMLTLDGQEITFNNILKQYKGKTIVIDVWASWCGDCLIGLPKLKAIQTQNTDLVYLFLSADRSVQSWKNGINKYQIKGDHYFMPKGMKSAFSKSIGLNWIPRYMIVDSNGNIKLFKATKADDIDLVNALN